jgi:hypothetical protein
MVLSYTANLMLRNEKIPVCRSEHALYSKTPAPVLLILITRVALSNSEHYILWQDATVQYLQSGSLAPIYV